MASNIHILSGKTVKIVQIRLQTMEIWQKEIATRPVSDSVSHQLLEILFPQYIHPCVIESLHVIR